MIEYLGVIIYLLTFMEVGIKNQKILSSMDLANITNDY